MAVVLGEAVWAAAVCQRRVLGPGAARDLVLEQALGQERERVPVGRLGRRGLSRVNGIIHRAESRHQVGTMGQEKRRDTLPARIEDHTPAQVEREVVVLARELELSLVLLQERPGLLV